MLGQDNMKQKVINLLAIMLLLFPYLAKGQSPKNPEAFIISQGFVKDNILTPSTAKFPHSAKAVKNWGKKYLIFGYLDLQNSNGAMVRANYNCEIIYKGGSWSNQSNWKLMFLTVGSELAYLDKSLTEEQAAKEVQNFPK